MVSTFFCCCCCRVIDQFGLFGAAAPRICPRKTLFVRSASQQVSRADGGASVSRRASCTRETENLMNSRSVACCVCCHRACEAADDGAQQHRSG